jgi:hypothetical protein
MQGNPSGWYTDEQRLPNTEHGHPWAYSRLDLVFLDKAVVEDDDQLALGLPGTK